MNLGLYFNLLVLKQAQQQNRTLPSGFEKILIITKKKLIHSLSVSYGSFHEKASTKVSSRIGFKPGTHNIYIYIY